MSEGGRPRRLPSWRIVREEAPRDQEESAFTPALRRVWASSPGIQAVAFVDDEGECIDYCSSIDPFEAKVTGAHMRMVLNTITAAVPKLGGGEMFGLEVYGADQDIVSRRVDQHHALVVRGESGSFDARVLGQIEAAVAELRHEAGMELPSWDPQSAPLQVEVRAAVGWAYAPASFVDRGRRVAIAAVLGMWTEHGGAAGGELSCFRVRTEDGVELTLAHDPERGRWLWS